MKLATIRSTEEKEERSERANALADRLLDGARNLATFASGLTAEQWKTPLPGDGRTIGVVVHHVASVYPVEIELAGAVAAGQEVTNLTMNDIHVMNAGHAKEFAPVTRNEAIELLRRNSAAAAEAIRDYSDADLDRAVPVSLYGGATVTSQFVLEDHAVRHSVHHLDRIRRALAC